MSNTLLGVAVTGIVISIALAVSSQISDEPFATAPAPAHAPTTESVPALALAPADTPVATKVTRPPIKERAENFQTPKSGTILTNAATAYGKVKTLRADFIQKRENPLLGSRTTSRGTIYQKRPDRFLMKFTQPAGDVIVSDGRYFWVYYPSADRRQVLRAPASDDGAGGVDLQAQFLGDPVKRFRNTFHGIEQLNDRSAYVLTLVPHGNVGYKNLKVWVDSKDWLVRRFVLTENNGVVQEFVLSKLSLNVPLSNDLFRFTPPQGAVIIDRP
jgi:outer membrane lipoprotein carrier protein